MFTAASVLCATATSLTEMVMFRALQGVGGAFIVPLAQATLFDINPREKHGQAMALFGGGVMIGPILGPVLGGWLTDNYNWRWVFLVNLPVGILCVLIMLRFMPKTETHERKFDMFGFALARARAWRRCNYASTAASRTTGSSSWETGIEAGLAIGAAWMFVVHMVTAKHPLFERAMFTDRNFATSLVFMAVTGVLLLAGLALLPPLLQNMYGYSVLQSGFLTAPRGVGTLFSMLIAGPADREGRRAAAGRHRRPADGRVALHDDRLRHRPAVAAGDRQRRRPGARPRPHLRAAADAGVRDAVGAHADDRRRASQPVAQHRRLGRHFGGQHAARPDDPGQHADLAAQITAADAPDRATRNAQTIAPVAGPAALAYINGEITKQALFIAYLDDFKLMMIVTFAVLPLLLFMKRGQKADETPLVTMD